ncbi:MAG TPA: hypothetical protein VN922_08145 [Bacteroidia bacterium]|nr:hypothetical protein [Bacteroidia bacterium]
MRNTTKLKHILQLYTLSFDMDDDGSFHLTAISKRTGNSETFIENSYSEVISKAFGYMNKQMKESLS